MNELHYTDHKRWSIFTILVTQAVLPDVDDGCIVEIPLHHIDNVDFLLVALDLEEEEGRLGLVVHDDIPDGALEAAPSRPEALEPLHERIPIESRGREKLGKEEEASQNQNQQSNE